MTINCNIDLQVEDIFSGLDQEELKDLILKLDLINANYDFTLDLILALVDSMKSDLKDYPEDAKKITDLLK